MDSIWGEAGIKLEGKRDALDHGGHEDRSGWIWELSGPRSLLNGCEGGKAEGSSTQRCQFPHGMVEPFTKMGNV